MTACLANLADELIECCNFSPCPTNALQRALDLVERTRRLLVVLADEPRAIFQEEEGGRPCSILPRSRWRALARRHGSESSRQHLGLLGKLLRTGLAQVCYVAQLPAHARQMFEMGDV